MYRATQDTTPPGPIFKARSLRGKKGVNRFRKETAHWRDLLVCSRYMAFFESVSFRIATVFCAEEPSFENRSGGVVSCVAYGKKCSTSVVRGTVTAKLGPRLKSAMFALLVRRDGTKEISSRQDGSQRAARDCSSRWVTRCFRSQPAPLV